jgi:undecaprenyl-diphosphatase
MFQSILKIDTDLFLYLNGINHSSLDSTIEYISNSIIPGIFIILLFLIFGYKKFGKKIGIGFIALLITFGLTDSISSKGFKDNIKRLRPMHEPAIMSQVYTAGRGRGGGKYGFVSSHAANTFGVVTFIFLMLGSTYKGFRLLFFWSTLVSFTRIYLGKHYPLDLICGAMLGILIAFICYKVVFTLWLKSKEPFPSLP